MKKRVFIFSSSFFSLPVLKFFYDNPTFYVKGTCFLKDYFKKKNSFKNRFKNFIGNYFPNLDDNFFYKDPYQLEKKKIYNYRKKLKFFFWTKGNEEIIKNFIVTQKIDIVILAGFKILEESFLSLAKDITVNIHPGILPENRGSSPVKWSIYLKKKMTGISIHKVSNKVDSGEIMYIKKIKLPTSINCFEAEELINNNIPSTLNNFLNNKSFETTSFNGKTYPNFNKLKSFINFEENFSNIEANLRALKPFTGIKYLYKDKLICIWEIKKLKKNNSLGPGLVLGKDDYENLIVTCRDYYCKITKILHFGKIIKLSDLNL